jgi:Ser/Thr protein kinase RdoA (MazF antagonist)
MEIDFELELLDYLDRSQVPVAATKLAAKTVTYP